jgi:hypothetical protein
MTNSDIHRTLVYHSEAHYLSSTKATLLTIHSYVHIREDTSLHIAQFISRKTANFMHSISYCALQTRWKINNECGHAGGYLCGSWSSSTEAVTESLRSTHASPPPACTLQWISTSRLAACPWILAVCMHAATDAGRTPADPGHRLRDVVDPAGRQLDRLWYHARTPLMFEEGRHRPK